jgi:2-dehydro-3-deoxygalactonokinase
VKRLVAIDWGTSALRAALLDEHGQALQERSLARGILSVKPAEFEAVFDAACADWMNAGAQFALIGGMAGSRQGWVETPYCRCPASFADVAAALAWVKPGRIAIVPGLCCESQGTPDVMRGEEIQVFGALQLLGMEQALLVLPGTHSKWVHVAGGRIETFSTFMTGEFYALLRQHSILARTLPQTDGEFDTQAFERGIHHAVQVGNLLQAAFSARTLALFDRMPAAALPSYLSGLVVGEELRSQKIQNLSGPAIVIGSHALVLRYELALRTLGVPARCVGSEATWSGLWAISRTLDRAL